MPNDPGKHASQEFLDTSQYTLNGILRYEWVFGDCFCSTGGKESTQEIVRRLNLKPGQRVLDIGYGLGGSAFYMAEEFGVQVLGVDLSTNMNALAKERRTRQSEKVQELVDVIHGNILQMDFPEASFDVIYSRDTFIHIGVKETVFTKVKSWLKPNGQFLVTDYIRGANSSNEESKEFKQYLADRQYNLPTIEEYEEVLWKSGFSSVKAEDMRTLYLKALRRELQYLRDNKEQFLNRFSEKDFRDLEGGWESKIHRIGREDQTWALFHSLK